jgi:hypothetical protein
MDLETASATLTRILDEAGFSFESPTLEQAIEAMTVFIRTPMEGIPHGPENDRVFCDAAPGGVDDPTDWSFGIYRQVFVAEDSQDMMRFGLFFFLKETPELSALAPAPDAKGPSPIELWRESSEVDQWLAEIRATPTFSALLEAPIAEVYFTEDPL